MNCNTARLLSYKLPFVSYRIVFNLYCEAEIVKNCTSRKNIKNKKYQLRRYNKYLRERNQINTFCNTENLTRS